MDNHNVDIVDFLERLSIENITEHGTEVAFSCPFDGHAHGDTNPSNSFNKETLVYNCLGCGDAGNIITFLAKFENISNSQAYKYIIDIFTPDFVEPKTTLYDEIDEMLKDLDRQDAPEQNITTEFWTIEPNDEAYLYMVGSRKFDPEILKFFNIGQTKDEKYVTIPMYNRDGSKMVGVKGRNLDQEARPKYMILGDTENSKYKGWGFKTYNVNDYLFNYHRVEFNSDIIIVEGELNAVAMVQMGYPNTVSFGGTALGKKQVDDLLDKAKTVTIMFDSDDAGKIATQNLVNIIEDKIYTYIIDSQHDDPADILKNSSTVDSAKLAIDNLLQNKINTLERYFNNES